MSADSTPKKRGPKPAPATVEGRDLQAEWAHLRTWYAGEKDLYTLAGIGRRVGLTKEACRALLTPPEDPTKAPRTAATLNKLENFQRLFSSRGYQPPTAHHQIL